MEIALWTLVSIFFLVIPNILFRRVYYSGRWLQELYSQNQFLLFVSSLVPGVIIHGTFLLIVLTVFKNSINTDEIHKIISDVSFNNEIHVEKSKIGILYVLEYNACLWVYSCLLAFGLKFIVRQFFIDRKFLFLRFRNKWYYIFSAEYLDFPGKYGRSKNCDTTWVDALVNLNGESVLYSGSIIEFECDSRTGDLETITLFEPRRTFISNPEKINTKEEHPQIRYKIPGDQLILKYSEIVNLNISYYHIEDGVPEHTVF